MRKPCTWKEELINDEIVFSTKCEELHYFNCGSIKENNYKYCPYCGGEIINEEDIKKIKVLYEDQIH